ncbi:MAG: glycosyltransferase [Patescibacteria group bacterium]
MKDLHIVVVSWNVREELERCLKSLPAACEGLDWECVVVDNASADDTVKMVERVFAHEQRIDILANDENMGFAKACNQGAVQHKARYVLLLNPDTSCPPGSLCELVRKMDLNPLAGIMGPKLLNPDGAYQQSVRRFPSLKDQLFILLKLHHFLPDIDFLQKYFGKDVNPDKAQSVDQVMGACFLVRAACWDQMHGLDQRYFIWFEEVDACKTAKNNGWLIWYEPSVSIMHHEGQSFGKAFTLKKQRYFNDSLLKYMLKWHGRLAWLMVLLFHPISLGLAAMVSLFKKPLAKAVGSKLGTSKPLAEQLKNIFKNKTADRMACKKKFSEVYWWLIAITVLEVVSYITLQAPLWRQMATIIAAVFVFYLAYSKPAKALAIIAAELWIGGFGYLLSISANGPETGISLRMALMAGFGLGWGINALKSRIWRFWKLNELMVVQVWILVGVMIVSGLFNGWYQNQTYLFQDANAWFFLLYFIPVLDIAHRHKDELAQSIRCAFIASAVWLPAKALFLFYIFSHGIIAIADPLYTWIRDTRVGEITPAGGNLFRIFFQSAIFSIVAGIFTFAYWIETQDAGLKTQDVRFKMQESRLKMQNAIQRLKCMLPRYSYWLIWILSVAMIVISLSRSYWVGSLAGFFLVFVLSIFHYKKLRLIACIKSIFGTILAFCLLAGVMYFPWPAPGEISLASMLKDRGTVTDAAGSSRWNLLPAMWDKIGENPIIGSGFGSTITYKSQDPRILKDHPNGVYTTYAFEWGWLSLWVKFGIFGPLVMLILLTSIIYRTWKSQYDWWIKTALISSIIAIAVVHIFTPYFDHPLGFSVLLLAEGALAIDRDEN